MFHRRPNIFNNCDQAKLQRSADSCRDKYREISTDYVKGRWKDNETEALKVLIREHLNLSPDADMVEIAKMVEREGITIPWSTISKKMGNRSRLSCFKKWQKMTGLGEKVTKTAGAVSDAKKKAAVAAAAAAVPPALGGEDLTPNPIDGEPGEDSEAAAAQIAAETVEAVDLPVLDEAGGSGGRTTRASRNRTGHVTVSV